MKHDPIETRNDPSPVNSDPLAEATQAVTELRAAAEANNTRHQTEVRALTERLAALETRANRPGTTTENPNEPSAERRAFATYLRLGDAIPADEQRALIQSQNPAGGYLAPPEMATEIIRDLVQFSPIRTLASIRQTTAPSVSYPTRSDITNAQWIGEGQQVTESNVSFGQLEIPVRELATFVDISNRLLADAPQAETEVRASLAEDFGKKEATAFLYGTGPREPAGLMVNPDIPVDEYQTALEPVMFIKLMYNLPAPYRLAGTWLMNGKTLASVRQFKDLQGQFLWQPSLQAGQPETILGRPVVEAVDLPEEPTLGATSEPVLFGDFSGYRIADRIGLDILVDPYTRRTFGQTRLHSTRRVGGGVLQPAKFRKMRIDLS